MREGVIGVVIVVLDCFVEKKGYQFMLCNAVRF